MVSDILDCCTKLSSRTRFSRAFQEPRDRWLRINDWVASFWDIPAVLRYNEVFLLQDLNELVLRTEKSRCHSHA
jgi:hypothetical protein